jgi:putative membrane protein
MNIVATIGVVFIAVIHIVISVVEILFWKNPLIHQRLDFTTEIANKVYPIVQNAGLYNSFIAAGLVWGAFATKDSQAVRVFFLICVVIAGIFGAFTLRETTLVLQTLPASIALIFVWLANARFKVKGG